MSVPRPRACALGVAPGSAPGEVSPRATIRRLAGPFVVAYHPSFAAIGGSINAGLFLAQLFYWHDRGRDPHGWIYKTQAEWEEETGLTRWQQEAARQLLREQGLVEEKLAGLPARLYYRLNVERLVQLLSARVGRTPSQPEESNHRGPGEAAQPAASPTGVRERHNQDCGSATYKHVGNPQTSSRDFHTHAETTNRDHSREQRTERLAAGSLADALAESVVPSSAGSDEAVSVTEAEPYPSERMCSLHGVPMRLRRKDGDHWYSHRLRDGTWCKGAPGDQGDDESDPQSIESRREYLAWADPDAHRRLPGAPRPADYGLYQAGPYRAAAPDTPPPPVHCTSAVQVHCTSHPNQPMHSTSRPDQPAHHQQTHRTSAVQVHCTSHPNQSMRSTPRPNLPMHSTSRPDQGRAPPTPAPPHPAASRPPDDAHDAADPVDGARDPAPTAAVPPTPELDRGRAPPTRSKTPVPLGAVAGFADAAAVPASRHANRPRPPDRVRHEQLVHSIGLQACAPLAQASPKPPLEVHSTLVDGRRWSIPARAPPYRRGFV